MHSRVIASRTQGARRALPWLVILLAHLAPSAAASPYLTRIAPPPLREREPFQPAPVVPVAAPATIETPAIQESNPPPPGESAPAPVATETQPPETAARTPAAPVAPPPPILQDPLRERVQLEDFLPFFTPPAAPAAAGPVSSATYRRE